MNAGKVDIQLHVTGKCFCVHANMTRLGHYGAPQADYRSFHGTADYHLLNPLYASKEQHSSDDVHAMHHLLIATPLELPGSILEG